MQVPDQLAASASRSLAVGDADKAVATYLAAIEALHTMSVVAERGSRVRDLSSADEEILNGLAEAVGRAETSVDERAVARATQCLDKMAAEALQIGVDPGPYERASAALSVGREQGAVETLAPVRQRHAYAQPIADGLKTALREGMTTFARTAALLGGAALVLLVVSVAIAANGSTVGAVLTFVVVLVGSVGVVGAAAFQQALSRTGESAAKQARVAARVLEQVESLLPDRIRSAGPQALAGDALRGRIEDSVDELSRKYAPRGVRGILVRATFRTVKQRMLQLIRALPAEAPTVGAGLRQVGTGIDERIAGLMAASAQWRIGAMLGGLAIGSLLFALIVSRF